jgi:hypothetical protein
MFNFGGSGVMADNKVTNANDAISANWSTGTQFLRNDVSKSGSGVHTDNNGGFGGVADMIQGNRVRDCNTDGYGIFVFAPYLSASADSNKVEGCYVGLAAFGSQVSGQGPAFSNNEVKGSGAKTTDPAGTYGAYLTTDLLGFGAGDLTATLTDNSFEHFGTEYSSRRRAAAWRWWRPTETRSTTTGLARAAAPAPRSTPRTTDGVASRARTWATTATPPSARWTTRRG